ncbi:hypothetical protein IC007_0366 [Sulfuracidifex tepidarius]|uniref:Uncharacterized protein n=1 Tax=Sulfuracidifex tepidarius TaxID=1294262 RepID=A0A510E040_9CREN|nr:hypothetical protein IC007_0366 [Sulfuracidifex tepidarius]
MISSANVLPSLESTHVIKSSTEYYPVDQPKGSVFYKRLKASPFRAGEEVRLIMTSPCSTPQQEE